MFTGIRALGRPGRRALWAGVAAVPSDPILGLVSDFTADPAPRKVNLAQGAYRTEGGQPLLLDAVREAEARVVARGASKCYLPIEGLPAFVSAAAAFALGDSCPALAGGRVASLQTLSGTGALRVCGDMLREIGGVDTVFLPRPSWGNHARVFEAAGLEVEAYPYLDAAGTALDFEAMAAGLDAVERGSVVLLHAAAHNPSGVDPTPGQWLALRDVFARRGLVPLFDTASAVGVRRSRGRIATAARTGTRASRRAIRTPTRSPSARSSTRASARFCASPSPRTWACTASASARCTSSARTATRRRGCSETSSSA